MLGRQAKVLSKRDLTALLATMRGPYAVRDRVIVLLAVRAGLRACEIAGLTWAMVLDADGRVGTSLEVHNMIAKKGAGRRVPLHPQLRRALKALRAQQRLGAAREAVIVQSARGGALRPNSIVNWFVVHTRQAGLSGCSSHSGRRTFITNAARNLHRVGASLRDVQLLAGHRSIETTQRYIDGDSRAQHRLVLLSL